MRALGCLFVIAIFSTVPLRVSLAQKLVDPDKVAPEYRAAAVSVSYSPRCACRSRNCAA